MTPRLRWKHGVWHWFCLFGVSVLSALAVIGMGGCGKSGSSRSERLGKANESRNTVFADFRDYRASLPVTMWSDEAIAGYLSCGRGNVMYLVQNIIGYYNEKVSSSRYLADIQHSLETRGWVRKSGGDNLNFWLQKGVRQFHVQGYKKAPHARSWLYGPCLDVGVKVAAELENRSKEYCASTVRVKGSTPSPTIGFSCPDGARHE
jgi:hypothetical protein